MKQLLILSGKGGTGKTTIASSFITLAHAKAFADCDVEAPNLHLLNQSGVQKKTPYYGMKKAFINQDICTQCGLCQTHCRFDAVTYDGKYYIDSHACEGCAVCAYVCPHKAIDMVDAIDGQLTLYTNNHIFSTAELHMGSGNSGKLVSEVKRQLNDQITDQDLVIIDGSPGIGCPVTASLSGVDMVLIVAEPSLSGMSDMKRIIKTAKIFNVKMAICINKYDVNLTLSQEIQDYADDHKIDFVGRVPYDARVIEYLNDLKMIVDEDFDISNAIKNIYIKTLSILNE